MVFVHELGHFLAAKRAGVRVEEFGFGYPPRVFTIGRRGETLYTINAIPFGGFVRLAGEDNPNVPDGLANQPKRVRAAILAAGPLMNFVLAVLCFILAFGLGWASGEGIRVTGVIENTPAVAAGFQSGDVIIAVDGIPVQTTTQFVDYVGARAGQSVQVTVRRNHDTVDLYVTPEFNAEAGRAQIGLYLGPKLTWGEAILEGFIQTGQVIYLTLSVPILLLRASPSLPAAPSGSPSPWTGGSPSSSLWGCSAPPSALLTSCPCRRWTAGASCSSSWRPSAASAFPPNKRGASISSALCSSFPCWLSSRTLTS
jgi:regulator of sigma E protease